MNLRLSDDELSRLRDQAATEGRSMQEVAQSALREYIDSHSLDTLVDRALDRVIHQYGGALERLGDL